MSVGCGFMLSFHSKNPAIHTIQSKLLYYSDLE
jgi:hypothetical protein